MVERVRPGVVRIESGDSVGTGVVFRSDNLYSYILTNAHVVEGHDYVWVILRDTPGRGVYCPVLGVDPVRDLAVVQTFNTDWPTLPFGDASVLKPGDRVVAMGYALGIGGAATVTEGIVSAVRYEASNQRWLIQTDAAINPGNSGGPLFNMAGEVVGINTFKLSDVVVEGLGFAVSAVTAKQQLQSLMNPPPRPTATPTPQAAPGYLFGPLSGELPHDPAGTNIIADLAHPAVNVTDIDVSATFINPYGGVGNDYWDCGFLIRRTSDNRHVRIIVTSSGYWHASGYTHGPPQVHTKLDSGRIEGGVLNRDGGHRNHIRFLARGARGKLFVNNETEIWVDLSKAGPPVPGTVGIATGLFEGYSKEGAVTRYENFKGKRP